MQPIARTSMILCRKAGCGGGADQRAHYRCITMVLRASKPILGEGKKSVNPMAQLAEQKPWSEGSRRPSG